ncbi:hypothetical protein CAL7716_061030 [Calothrix sp. PCC 7716]|nr:hypothetical protein CAL7716_061030 [Calothrix sp. PCC 7716]
MYQPEHSPGDIIHGRYKIINFISRGGFGETYKVEDAQQANLICLLKYLRPQNSSPTVLRLAEEKFAQEADILRRLGSHNQIPQLYDYFEENLKFYLVEEYIDGQNLANELRMELFSETKVIEVLYDVLKIIDYLSQNYVIHRDIKPENLIRRSSDNKIVLVDFGAVKEVGTLVVNAQGQTILTMAIGTPGFMAPEQLDGKPQFASDIYALGVTALFLLTRQIPVLNQYNNSIFNGVRIQPHFAKILENMVRYKYEERYHNASDVLADLEPLTLLGQVLNHRYEINSYLGGEGLIYTYSAQDKQRPYQANCIIKQLKLTHYNQRLLQEAQNRFSAAVQSLKTLPAHQQIPQISDHFQNNKEFYLIYDFIDGESLSKQITAVSLSEVEVTALLKDILNILSFIHQHGVIHGDIKSSNLIKRHQDGKFCLINFADLKQIANLSFNGQNIIVPPRGTNGYMAPEQFQNRLQANSDIYSLGMTAIQALTKIYPDQLQRDSQDEVIWQNQAQVSSKLTRILNKMVRFQAGKRYQSAQSVLNDLNTQTLQEKLEKYWKVLVLIGITLSALLAFRIYIVLQELQRDNFFNQGFEKKQEGDNKKNNGDIIGANKAYDEAIQKFNQALEIDSTFTKAKVNLGYTHVQRGSFTKSLIACNDAKKDDYNNPKIFICLGNAKHGLKQYEEALQDYEQSIKLASKPDDIDDLVKALTNKGESLLALQKFNDALEAYTQATQKQPNNSIAWTGKGKALLSLEKYNDALDAFRKALTIKNDYKPAIDGEKEARKRLNLP